MRTLLNDFSDRSDKPDRPERPFWWWVLIASFAGMMIVSAWRGDF
jgi:hypothetical protein